MLNKVILIGRVGTAPELRTFDNGLSLVRLSLATNETYKNKNDEWKEQTEWHNIVLWRELGDRAHKYVNVGDLLYIQGKLTSRSWEDKEGNKRSLTEIKADKFKILTRKKNEVKQVDMVQEEIVIPDVDEDDDLPF